MGLELKLLRESNQDL